MTADDWKKSAGAAAETMEDLRGRLAQALKLLADKSRAFESMRVTNLDLVRRLSEAVAGQMVLRARIAELERQFAELRDWRVH